MKKLILSGLGFAVMASVMVSCMYTSSSNSANENKAPSNEEIVKRGEYLVTTIGCNDCHSPKRVTDHGLEVIPELLLSGYPGDRAVPKMNMDAINSGWGLFNYDLTSFVGPWGESFAGNLTPDATGIGTWSEEQFKKALTQGKFKGLDGSRNLLPPMPWFNWTSMKDEDVHAIYLYLKSIPPVRNVVPAAIPPDALASK